MKIYIPTRGRFDNQITARAIPAAWEDSVIYVVNKEDEKRPELNGHPRVICDSCVTSIGGARQAAVDYHARFYRRDPKMLMLDDDLRFFVRRVDDPTKFEKAAATDVDRCFQYIESLLDTHAHCGIMAREGGNRVTEPMVENTRLLRALAYRVDVLKQHNVRFDRLIVMEDFDVSLQLLELGYKNASLGLYVQDQTRSNAPGGCSLYRTLERQSEGAIGLSQLHPKFVQVVRKKTTTAWNGQERTDVTVGWKQAFKSWKGEARVL